MGRRRNKEGVPAAWAFVSVLRMIRRRLLRLASAGERGDNKGFWQRCAGIYDRFMKGSAPVYREICARIEPSLNRKMDVLELACGSGILSFALAGKARLWEATDFSEAMIAEAKKKGRPDNLYFSVQDATRLPYGPETFDVVVIANALHIMPEPEKALLEIRRVLKKDGLLFAPTFVQGNGRAFRLRQRLMEFAGFHTYHKWREKEFLEFLEAQGFSVTEQEMLGGGLLPLCFVAARAKLKQGDGYDL